MKKFIIATSIVLCVLLVFVGNHFWNNQIEETTAQAYEQLGIERPVTMKSGMMNANEHVGNEDALEESGNVQAGNSAKENRSSQNEPTQSGQSSPSTPTESTQPKNETQTQAGSTNGSGSQAAPKPKSLLEIKRSYYSAFEELQRAQEQNAATLVENAKKDYERVKANEITRDDFIRKYQADAIALESSTDAMFDEKYRQLRRELAENGHNPSEAVEFQIAYERKKEEYQLHVVRELSNLN